MEQQIRDAYWSLAAAQAQERIAGINRDEAQRLYDLTKKQQAAGASPTADVIRSSIDLANAKQALIAAKTADRTALIAFNTLLAQPPGTPQSLKDDLASESAASPKATVPSLQAMNKDAQSERPLLKASQAQVDSARYTLRQTEATRWPDLTVDYERSLRQSIDSVVFSANFPLVDFGSLSGQVKSAREAQTQARAQHEQNKQLVRQQVAQARGDLTDALESATSYSDEIVEPSKKLLEMAKLGYEQGATGILPVIDAESTLRNARVGFIGALLAVYKAQDEVLAATGTGALSLRQEVGP